MLLTGIFWSVSLKSTEQVKFYILQCKWSGLNLKLIPQKSLLKMTKTAAQEALVTAKGGQGARKEQAQAWDGYQGGADHSRQHWHGSVSVT